MLPSDSVWALGVRRRHAPLKVVKKKVIFGDLRRIRAERDEDIPVHEAARFCGARPEPSSLCTCAFSGGCPRRTPTACPDTEGIRQRTSGFAISMLQGSCGRTVRARSNGWQRTAWICTECQHCGHKRSRWERNLPEFEWAAKRRVRGAPGAARARGDGRNSHPADFEGDGLGLDSGREQDRSCHCTQQLPVPWEKGVSTRPPEIYVLDNKDCTQRHAIQCALAPGPPSFRSCKLSGLTDPLQLPTFLQGQPTSWGPVLLVKGQLGKRTNGDLRNMSESHLLIKPPELAYCNNELTRACKPTS